MTLTEELIFRRATLEDFEDVYRLYVQLVGPVEVSDGQLGLQKWQKILDHSGTEVHGVEKNGRLLSIATLHIMPNLTYSGRPYALIENVVTDKEHQGLGLGTLIMEHVIQRARQENAYKIMLLTGKQHSAKAFYEKLGFGADEKHGMTLRRVPIRQ